MMRCYLSKREGQRGRRVVCLVLASARGLSLDMLSVGLLWYVCRIELM